MRTQFVSIIRSRSFRIRAWVWGGVATVLFAAVVAGALVWLSGHHLVRTEKGWVAVSKRFVGLSDTCVDIRKWKWDDAVAHHEVSHALINSGYSDLLPEPPPEPTALEHATQSARQLRDGVMAAGSNAWQRVKGKAAEWKNAHTEKVPSPQPPSHAP